MTSPQSRLPMILVLVCACLQLPWHEPSNAELLHATCLEAPGVDYFGDLRAVRESTVSRLVLVDGKQLLPRQKGNAYLMDSRGAIYVGSWRTPEAESLHVAVSAIGVGSIMDGRWVGDTLFGAGLLMSGADSTPWTLSARKTPCPATATRPGRPAA